jgi:hypothetical protein
MTPENGPDWDRLIEDVTSRIAALKAAWTATAADSPKLHAKLSADLYIPVLRLLADFCDAVDIEDIDNDAG